jgi:uncharacterized membrane protein
MNSPTAASVSFQQAPADALTEKPRISSIDMMRGIVMVIMALDHARDFFHLGGFAYNPTDMNTTTPVLFFTRWITHFCAPTFVLLAGTSIFISSQRKSKKDLSVFLLTRGLWLLAIEVIVMRFSFFFNFYFDVIVFQVIWVIGASMICMAALIHLPYRAVLAIGLVLSFGHNLTDSIQLQPGDAGFTAWAILRQSGFFPITPSNNLFVLYPLFPWLGIMILGYCLGRLYTKEFNPENRQKLLFRIGLAALALFVVLRLINSYGDPAPWSVQKTHVFTFMSFLNVTKYPVSLLYTLLTLGPVLMILSWMEKVNLHRLRPFAVFGRVPLFFYILHFYIIHSVALILYLNKFDKSLSDLDFHFDRSFGGLPPEAGYSLFWAYVGWIAVVLFLYPFCRWYNQYKSTHRNWWLSYL